MIAKFKRFLYLMSICVAAPAIISAVLLAIGYARTNRSGRPRLVWGSTPIINYSYWARAMRESGYESETFTFQYYSSINSRTDWGRLLSDEYPLLPTALKPFWAFIDSIVKYDVYFISFDGYFIGKTPLWWIQAHAFKWAGKHVVVMPYGSDSYVYRNIRSTGLLHGLLLSYPLASRQQERIARDVAYWCRHADVLIPGFMAPDGFGRWDVLVPSPLGIDLVKWRPTAREQSADGLTRSVRIAHAPNHRGFKGTEFVIDAVEKLQEEGLQVELVLLEKLQNQEVRSILSCEVDILVEQLVATGHGLNGVEGMACGLPVVSNLENETYMLPFRRWSFFGECPIVSASPESITDVLRKLVTRPELRNQLGVAGRQYVEKYHGLDSSQYLFGSVLDYLEGRRESLENLYHPLFGEYPKRKPTVPHPLVKNQIID